MLLKMLNYFCIIILILDFLNKKSVHVGQEWIYIFTNFNFIRIYIVKKI